MKSEAAPLVIGGGPAGSMFALSMARAGRAVTLLEKSKGAHDKVCGDFLSRESAVYLESLGLHPRTLGAVPVRTVRVITSRCVQESALPFAAWSLTRRALDEALLREAALQGAEVVRDAHVMQLQQTGENWTALLRDGRSFRTRHVVLASGKLDVNGWARPTCIQPHLLGFKMYFRLTEEQHRALGETVELLLYPGGYMGLEPVEGGVVNATMLVDARDLRASGVHWDAVLRYVRARSTHLRERLEGAVEMLPKPLAVSRIPYGHLQSDTEDGLWRVGDQAAVIPSLCGDGTSIALHSGALAATCLLQGMSASAYQRRLHRQLATRLRFATGLSRVLLRWPQASHCIRIFPGLLRFFAAVTRIPESAMVAVQGSDAQCYGGELD